MELIREKSSFEELYYNTLGRLVHIGSDFIFDNPEVKRFKANIKRLEYNIDNYEKFGECGPCSIEVVKR